MLTYRFWKVAAFTFACLLTLNLICWAPGVGSSSGDPPGGRPRGTDLERSFGWPSQYRAELWHSDDPNLSDQILKVAPFYFPGQEMQLQVRYWGAAAIAVNVLFALVLAATAGIVLDHSASSSRHRPPRWLVIFLLVCLAALLLGATRASVHL